MHLPAIKEVIVSNRGASNGWEANGTEGAGRSESVTCLDAFQSRRRRFTKSEKDGTLIAS